jgi:murein DD-endopeptidase MepM/ murein hydrolase activator NlpD
MAKRRAIHLSGVQLLMAGLAASLALMLTAAGLYHWVFLKGAREGWPVIGSLVKMMVQDEFDQRDRFMRENIDAMAKRLGEMQARMTQLDALSERVSSLAGINLSEVKPKAGSGGLLVGSRPLTSDEMQSALAQIEELTHKKVDLLTVVESRLFDQKIKKMMIPTKMPVANAPLGSGFGWRIDPFTGTSALHTGMDFQAEVGAPILAAAGGIVVTQERHPAYGNMIEVDHGNQLITRYAHASSVYVKKGDLIKRGQKIAAVGTTGRSTGPHLHFEVLVQGVPQNPQKFLAAGQNLGSTQTAHAHPATAPIKR